MLNLGDRLVEVVSVSLSCWFQSEDFGHFLKILVAMVSEGQLFEVISASEAGFVFHLCWSRFECFLEPTLGGQVAVCVVFAFLTSWFHSKGLGDFRKILLAMLFCWLSVQISYLFLCHRVLLQPHYWS